MNLQQVRYVVATAEHGTMTAAARFCHVAQPALTRAVRALERELGLTLFERRGRGVELTAEGRIIVEAARRLLAEVALIESVGRNRRQDQVLTIAATPTIQTDLASGLIQELWAQHPEYPVKFVHCESRQLVGEAVASGVADVGVTDLPAAAGLQVVEFESREVVIVAPPGSDLPEPLPVKALAGMPMILPTQGSLRRVAFDRMFADLGITPPVAFESDERSSWIPAVLAGVGSCVWYRSQGETGAAFGAEIRGLDPPLRRPIGVVYRHDQVPPAVRALVELARTRARNADLSRR